MSLQAVTGFKSEHRKNILSLWKTTLSVFLSDCYLALNKGDMKPEDFYEQKFPAELQRNRFHPEIRGGFMIKLFTCKNNRKTSKIFSTQKCD